MDQNQEAELYLWYDIYSFYTLFILIYKNRYQIYCFDFVFKRGVPAKGSKPKPLTSVQDINIQSQALLNVKDSNKVFAYRFYAIWQFKKDQTYPSYNNNNNNI